MICSKKVYTTPQNVDVYQLIGDHIIGEGYIKDNRLLDFTITEKKDYQQYFEFFARSLVFSIIEKFQDCYVDIQSDYFLSLGFEKTQNGYWAKSDSVVFLSKCGCGHN